MKIRRNFIEYLILIVGLISTYIISLYNYLLFHSITEIISIVISGGIFLIGWHSRKYMKSSFFLIIGVSVLFISAFDLIHTLSYSGMGVFPQFDANLPTQLWIIARYWQAFSYLFASIFIKKKINVTYLFISYIIALFILFFIIFQGFFPVCYVEGLGLTPFKIISEYIISITFVIMLIVLYRNKEEFDQKLFFLILISIVITIISELAFTFYISVFGFSNFIGHVLKIIAFFFIYKAIIKLGIETPFNLLFRKLKQSEETSIEKANQLEQLYSEFNQMFNASLPLRVISKDCDIIRVNDTFTSLFRISKEEIIGKKCYDLKIGYEHRCHTKLCSKNQIQEGKEFYEYELLTNFDDGTKLVSLVRTVPYKDLNGEFIGIIQNYTDITERKEAERSLERFVSTVSHELRTPVSVLIMSLDFLQNHSDNVTPEINKNLQDGIKRNIFLLKELIDDILTLSRIDENKIKLKWEVYNPLSIIKNILILMEPIGNSKNITFSVDIEKEIILYGDPIKIDQIFRIFIDNSLKYSEENSKIEISAINHYKGKYNVDEKNGVLFTIKDYGVGIKEEDLPFIFQRFFRSEQVSNIPGTGLGLSIAKELLKLHHGNVWVESDFGKETTFFVFLPIIIKKI